MPKKSKTPKSSTKALLKIGSKPSMSYVLFTVNQMKDAKEITIQARGKSIHRAVDVAEILRRKFFPNLEVKNIVTGTEQVEDEKTQRKRNISTIEITVVK